ncbi:MAG: O-methyltransferase [Xanthobacteraceae bacterium]
MFRRKPSIVPDVEKLARPYLAISRVYSRLLLSEKNHLLRDGAPKAYPESWIDFDQLGSPAPYRKTFPFPADYLNDQHRFYSECKTGLFGIAVCIDIGIEGYLQRGDALKLYEMAFFCEGDVLELGTHKGLSTSILLQALQASNRLGEIYTVDIDRDAGKIAKSNIDSRPGAGHVHFNLEDAGSYMRRAISEGRKFGLIFIDHWHGYDATFEAATLGKALVAEGGFILFHDYNDPSNRDPGHVYGVYQAVADVLLPCSEFMFYGNFGCCGLFRKQERGEPT